MPRKPKTRSQGPPDMTEEIMVKEAVKTAVAIKEKLEKDKVADVKEINIHIYLKRKN
jgi:hypothetical protein